MLCRPPPTPLLSSVQAHPSAPCSVWALEVVSRGLCPVHWSWKKSVSCLVMEQDVSAPQEWWEVVWVSRVSRERDHPLEATSSEEVKAAFVSLLSAACLVIIPPHHEHRPGFPGEIPTRLAHGRVHNTPSTKINSSQRRRDAWLGETLQIHETPSCATSWWWADLHSQAVSKWHRVNSDFCYSQSSCTSLGAKILILRWSKTTVYTGILVKEGPFVSLKSRKGIWWIVVLFIIYLDGLNWCMLQLFDQMPFVWLLSRETW